MATKSIGSNVDRNPDLAEKKTRRLSPNLTLRRREPTADMAIVAKHPNMVWDYQNQQRVWPNGDPRALIEATQKTGTKYDTINRSGHPFALKQREIGGSPDTRGQLYARPQRLGLLK